MKKWIIGLTLLASLNGFAETRKFTVVNHQFEGTKQWLPGTLVVNEGDDVEITLINNAPSGVHNYSIPQFKVDQNVLKGKKATVKFKADKPGLWNVMCGLHKAHVGGQFIVIADPKNNDDGK